MKTRKVVPLLLVLVFSLAWLSGEALADPGGRSIFGLTIGCGSRGSRSGYGYYPQRYDQPYYRGRSPYFSGRTIFGSRYGSRYYSRGSSYSGYPGGYYPSSRGQSIFGTRYMPPQYMSPQYVQPYYGHPQYEYAPHYPVPEPPVAPLVVEVPTIVVRQPRVVVQAPEVVVERPPRTVVVPQQQHYQASHGPSPMVVPGLTNRLKHKRASRIAELVEDLNSGDEDDREDAVEDLAKFPFDPQINGILGQVLLFDPSPDVREEAAKALGRTGDSASVPVLIEAAIRDREDDVREEAREALEKVTKSPDARVIIRVLGEVLLLDPDVEVRKAAAEELGELKNRIALPVLKQALKDPNIRREVEEAIGQIEGHRRPVSSRPRRIRVPSPPPVIAPTPAPSIAPAAAPSS